MLLVSQAPQRGAWCRRVVRLDGGRVLGESPEGSRDGERAPEAGTVGGGAPMARAWAGGGAWRAPLPGVVVQAWTILRKDLPGGVARGGGYLDRPVRLLSLVVFAFALDLRTDNAALVVPGALWIAITFCGVRALGRSLGLEQERETLEGLLLAPLDRGPSSWPSWRGARWPCWWWRRCWCRCARSSPSPAATPAAPVLLLGTLGFAGVGTLTGAMTVKARSRGCSSRCSSSPGRPRLDREREGRRRRRRHPFGPWLGLLLAYDAIFLVLSWWLFEFVVED